MPRTILPCLNSNPVKSLYFIAMNAKGRLTLCSYKIVLGRSFGGRLPNF